MVQKGVAYMLKIVFHSNKIYNKEKFAPVPAGKKMPQWWQDSELYVKDPSGNPYAGQNGIGKMPSFKACPAMLDTFTTGYVLVTPCDIEFYERDGKIKAKLETGFDDFVGPRPAMDGFETPIGCSPSHFHWYANWAPQLPEGYSCLYIPPVNHFELPWITVGGIIDSDTVTNSGLIPFFIKEGFTGVVPAGTPYLQIIPFKRDDWESEIIFHTGPEIFKKHKETSDTFRTPEGGVYKKDFWHRRKYK
jgi:hypothetical protein